MRQRRYPPNLASFPRDASVRAPMLGLVFGDYKMVESGWRGSWWGQCASGHRRLFNGGQLRTDKKAGRYGPRCKECASKAMANVG